MTRASRFEGSIGHTVAESDAWFDEPPHPGDDAPNVVLVLLDDTGFAQFGCYGSDIDMPNLHRNAAHHCRTGRVNRWLPVRFGGVAVVAPPHNWPRSSSTR